MLREWMRDREGTREIGGDERDRDGEREIGRSVMERRREIGRGER